MAQGQAGDPAVWASGSAYQRYWLHYQSAMTWYQRHRHAYRKALEAAHRPGPGLQPAAHWRAPQRYGDWQAAEEEDGGEMETDEEEDQEDEIECDVSNMEISEELREYFAQTEKHREELKKQQQLDAEQLDCYVPADRDLHRASWLGSAGRGAPCERPGERRSAEMKKLYGEDAAKIQAMEAAMQLNFDRNCDKKQPKYWPVIPLRL